MRARFGRYVLCCLAAAALAATASAQTRYTTVVIDPGHGGFDPGGIPGQRVAEKVMNLDVAQRLRTVLQSSGYRVVMTRDSDVFVPLGSPSTIRAIAISTSYFTRRLRCTVA